jgi:hypothetical protein
LERENQRLRAILEKRDEQIAQIRQGEKWHEDPTNVVERHIGPEGAAF